MELIRYLRVVWHRKWVIASVAVVTTVVALCGALLLPRTYVATVTLRVATAADGSIDQIGWDDIQYADRLMNTYIVLATSDPMREDLARRLQLDSTPEVAVEVPANTELMHVAVEQRDPFRAAEAANVLADMLIEHAKSPGGVGSTGQSALDAQLAQAQAEADQARQTYENAVATAGEASDAVATTYRALELKQQTYDFLLEQRDQALVAGALRGNVVSIISPAAIPTSPAGPHPALIVLLGLLVGLAGGVALAFVLEHLDTTLNTTEQIEDAVDWATLGRIPVATASGTAIFNHNSPQEEAFRRLRTNLIAQTDTAPLKTLIVTSADPHEGKSTVAANLGASLAKAGLSVLLIDGDLRLPRLHEIFNLPNHVGLSSLLRQRASQVVAIQATDVAGLKVLTSGPLPSNPVELLGSPQMARLLEELADDFDLVLVDTPSLLAVTDAAVLAHGVDGVLFVVGRSRTRRESVHSAAQQLASVHARPVGMVINRAEDNRHYRYYQHQTADDDGNEQGYVTR